VGGGCEWGGRDGNVAALRGAQDGGATRLVLVTAALEPSLPSLPTAQV